MDETAYCTNPPKLKPKTHRVSKECCKFINKCFTEKDRKRPSAEALLEMDWMKQIRRRSVKEKWAPWFIEIDDDDDHKSVDDSSDGGDRDVAMLDAIGLSLSPKQHSKTKSKDLFEEDEPSNSKKGRSKKKKSKKDKKDKKKKSVKFEDDASFVSQDSLSSKPQPAEFNEDLFFMITSMVIYYLTQSVDFAHEHSASNDDLLKRRQSQVRRSANDSGNSKMYSDEERIGNMAKYAHCSRETVREKIRVTVSHIKTQMSKMEMMHGQ